MRVRGAPKRNGSAEEAVTAASPALVENTLLVVGLFKDRGGREYRPGDRAPLQQRDVRLAAFENPELFRMEYETVPVDLEWLRRLDERYEGRYQAALQAREAEKTRRELALRAELEEQNRRAPELERRYEAQEKEREERERASRDEIERDKLEQGLAAGNSLLSGFHYDDN